jgi:Putative peptidoglycan binding domain
MKKFTAILISCSLALAATAIAQQEEEQGKVKKGKDQSEKTQPANEAKPAPKSKSVPKEHAETKVHGQQTGETNTEATGANGAKTHGKNKAELNTESTTESGAKTPDMNRTHGKNKAELNTESTTESGAKTHNMTKGAGKESGANVNADATVTGQEQGVKGNKKERGARTESAVTKEQTGATTGVGANTQTSAAVDANKPNLNANVNANVNTKVKVNVDKVNARGGRVPDIQTIRTQHASFRAQARPDKVPAVTFNQSYRINGSEQWQGENYARFRSYRPERRDRGWYSSHNYRIELIGGGYYYYDGGYAYPAWGYDSSAEYYPYDGPVYVGSHAQPLDRTIADVQSALQEMGYYRGEVDGLLGPMTRDALTAYQADNGLYTTATIDEPTLDSLGMG